jgi:LPS export ABC transporter protein LptC
LVYLVLTRISTKTHFDQPHNPDAIAINVTYTQMDENGMVHHIIYTPKLIHYPYQNSSAFQEPDITIINLPENPWHITADQGTSQYGTNIINLLNNVKLHQAAGPHNTALTITTNAATIHAHEKYVTTDQAITVKKPGTTITAVGAEAYVDKKTINLLSEVKEKYVPNKK